MQYLARKLTDDQETLKTIYYSLVQILKFQDSANQILKFQDTTACQILKFQNLETSQKLTHCHNSA